MSAACATRTLRTGRPLMVSARMSRARSNASLGECASLTPPALPRPPACTCALITIVPPIEAAISRASSGVSATCPGSTGIPKRAKSSLPWYSCRFIHTSVVVDLRALHLAAEVHVEALPLGERVEHGVAGLAVAVAGAARAAERQVRLGAGGAVVHVDDAGGEVAHRGERGVHVRGEDRRRQPERRGVVDRDRLLERADAEEAHDGPED